MSRNSNAAAGQADFGIPVVAGACVVALVVGIAFGHFVLGGGKANAAFSGKTTVAESELDTPMASYTYDGKVETVTVKEAIESQTSLDQAKADDGTYTLPSADTVLAEARNEILAKVAADKGISVSDDELPSYAEQMVGESDIATIANTYGISEDNAKEIIRSSAVVKKLQEQVVTTAATSQPSAPATPEDGKEDEANATYGAYVVGLLGDEWDSDKGTWARTDGPFYDALKDESFSADSATYAQAKQAYYVAYQQYSSSTTAASSEWSNYVNGLLSSATIQLYTLGA